MPLRINTRALDVVLSGTVEIVAKSTIVTDDLDAGVKVFTDTPEVIWRGRGTYQPNLGGGEAIPAPLLGAGALAIPTGRFYLEVSDEIPAGAGMVSARTATARPDVRYRLLGSTDEHAPISPPDDMAGVGVLYRVDVGSEVRP